MDWYQLIRKTIELKNLRFEERPLQKRIINYIQEHFENEEKISTPLLVRLPCGYGKTQVGESPFLAELYNNNWVTRGLVYVLPTRALTSQQKDRIENDVNYVTQMMKNKFRVTVQDFHGETGTYYFFADAAISTFDTFVYAYARKSRTGHHLEFPAGTIATSYVVFDEAHMLQDEYLYSHLVLNRILKSLSKAGIPTIIMTATMPEILEEVIFDGIDYIKEPDINENSRWITDLGEYRGEVIRSEVHKINIVDFIKERLTYDKIYGKKVLIIVNTVKKAQTIYSELVKKFSKNKGKGIIVLIHSRLMKKEKKRRVNIVETLMKKKINCATCNRNIRYYPVYVKNNGNMKIYCESCAPSKAERIEYVILVSTQVVEAGLDISADWLLTDMAPLDALVQRAGRCARFKGEKGEIDLFYYANVHTPYQRKLVESSYEIIQREDAVKCLTDFIFSSRVINENYEKLQKQILDDSLRLYLSYLEGLGFSTFTVNWNVMRRISARPNAFINLVVLREDEKLTMYELIEEQGNLSQGRFKIFVPKRKLEVDYGTLLLKLSSGKKIAIETAYVKENSFTLSYPYAFEKGKPKDFLKHTLNKENFLIELRPVVVDNQFKNSREIFYLLEKISFQLTPETNCIVNPKFYRKEEGLII